VWWPCSAEGEIRTGASARGPSTECFCKDLELKKLRANEVQLPQTKRQLQADKECLALEVARRVDQERAQIREAALNEADNAHRLKSAEKDLKLAQALRMNEELRRKLEQGSQQIQGEALELAPRRQSFRRNC
jgi:hypothetical protein